VRPDWVFMTKGENLRAETFTMIKRKFGTHLAIWYVDNPFHANVSSYQALRHIQKADIYFIWAKYLMDPLISAGAKRVEYLPFAFDPEIHPDVVTHSADIDKWRSDVCFVGTWDPERESYLLPLAGQSFDLAIYGQGWKSFLPAGSPLRRHVRADAIWMEDVVKAFKGTCIVLNLIRRHNWKSHNFRTMEAAGIGGGVLATPWSEDQARILFCAGSEILCFPGPTPTVQWITSALAAKENLALMASKGRKRVFEEHLLSQRISDVWKLLKEAM
jgi:spore maturation protein CgeB